MQKRSNPFAARTNPFQETKEVVKEEKNVEEIVEEPVQQVVIEEEEELYVPKPQVTQHKQQNRPAPVVQSNRYSGYASQPKDNNRVKYTSTMDQDLRREIKFACVTKGIMFAQFVEEACMEKLKRERGR